MKKENYIDSYIHICIQQSFLFFFLKNLCHNLRNLSFEVNNETLIRQLKIMFLKETYFFLGRELELSLSVSEVLYFEVIGPPRGSLRLSWK